MKRTVRNLIVAMVLAVALYGGYAVYTGLGKLGASLGHFAPWAFGAACLFALTNYLLRFCKWEFYLGRLGITGVKKSDSLLTFLSGFVLTVTPGKVGEVFKSVVLQETHGVPIARSAPIVVAERVTDLIGVIVLIAIGSMGFAGGLVWAVLAGVLVLALWCVVASPSASHALIARIESLPGPFRRLGPRLREARGSLKTLLLPRNLVVPTLLSILAWGCECMSLWVILRGFGESIGVPLAAFFYATSTLAGALVPVPGGLGVTEGALTEQLEALGHVAVGTSTAAMMLVRFATLWFAVGIGFGALALLRGRYPSLLSAQSPTAKAAAGSLA